MAFGYHLMLDMYQCTGSSVSSLGDCYDFLEKLCDLLKMTKQSPPFLFQSDEVIFPDKAGLSGWLPLIESGIQIHTLSKVSFVSLDVYSCKKFDSKKVIEASQDVFIPKYIENQFVLRGSSFDTISNETK